MIRWVDFLLRCRGDFLLFAFICLSIIAVVHIGLTRSQKASGMPFWVHFLLLVLILFGGLFAEMAGQREKTYLKEIIQAFAPTYAEELKKRGHDKIHPQTSPEDPHYLSLIQTLIGWLQLNPSLNDIYTFRTRPDGKVIFIVDSETDYDRNGKFDGDRESRTAIGEVWENPPHGVEQALQGKENFDSAPYNDRWGTWVSAYAPMRDSKGNVEGVLGVDYAAGGWLRAIAMERLGALTLTAIPILIFLIGAVISIRRKQYEEAIFKSKKLEAIGQLAGGMAHDFNNLLTVINGYAGLRTEMLPKTDPLHHDFQEIAEAGRRAAVLTDRLLAYTGRQMAQLSLLDVNEWLKSMKKIFAEFCGNKIEFRFELSDSSALIRGNSGQLEEAITHILNNSKEALSDKGVVTLKCNLLLVRRKNPAAQPDLEPGEYVVLSIQDNGPGIEEAVKTHIFEPFYTTKPDKLRNSGMGLALVYGIVKQAGGHTLVKSAAGEGTTVEIYLPRVRKTAETGIGRSSASSGGTETVLVVDDEGMVRNFACTILQHGGYQVVSAAEGEEALKIASTLPEKDIHLLFTDTLMPRMGGKKLAVALKKIRPGIKVLFSSGYTSGELEELGAIDSGIEFIQKPYSAEDLLGKVHEVLQSAH